MNPRLAAARALAAVLNGKASLGSSLPPLLERVEPRDRALAQDLAFGTARWQPRLELLAGKLLQKPFKAADRDVEALLLIGLYQLLHTRIPAHAAIGETVACVDKLKKASLKGLLNAVLRNAQRSHEALLAELERDPVLHTAHPRWLQKRLKADWPEHWKTICAANNEHPPLILRVNRRHGSRDDYLAELRSAGIQAEPCAFSRDGIRLLQPCDVKTLPGFTAGRVSVQDEAAQLAADLLGLAPGQRVLDACAAPGGKTCAILEACGELHEVVAIDESAERLPRVQENLDRLDLHATLTQADAADIDSWWDGAPFDRILLDVPCSATGVIRRHPDIKLLRRESDIVPLASIQLGLLEAMWSILKPGGRLVYATCSVFPQENHRIIQRFLKQQEQATLVQINADWGRDMDTGRQLLPDPDSHDGFFYAVLEKPDA